MNSGEDGRTGTALIHIPRKFILADVYVMLPDRTVRKPIGAQDWMYWRTLALVTGSDRVGEDVVGDMRISTVFLNLDHDYGTSRKLVVKGPSIDDIELIPPIGYQPLIFETMIFGGALDMEKWRYRTYKKALFGHKRAVLQARAAWAKAGGKQDQGPEIQGE